MSDNNAEQEFSLGAKPKPNRSVIDDRLDKAANSEPTVVPTPPFKPTEPEIISPDQIHPHSEPIPELPVKSTKVIKKEEIKEVPIPFEVPTD